MEENETEDGFVSLLCPSCRQEIEASLDMIGQQSECPACGTKISIPATSELGTSRNPFPKIPGGASEAQRAAMKSRTIRIELDDGR